MARAKSTTKRKPAKNPTEITQHPFAPGSKVVVHDANAVEFERRSNAPPSGKPLARVTVKKNGELVVSGLDHGSYVASAEVEGPPIAVRTGGGLPEDPTSNDEVQYVAFQVK
jgi:hypothetical protein